MQKNIKPLKPAHIACAVLVLCAVFLFAMSGGNEEGTDLERRMANVLSGIRGAGEVQVLINTAQGQAVSAWSVAAGTDTEVVGVLIVAQGASDPLVCARLAQAACTVLGVEQSCVSIVQMEK